MSSNYNIAKLARNDKPENYIAKFVSDNGIGASLIQDSGNIVNVSGSLTVNNINVSVSGHDHTTSDISNFNSSVSGLLPSVSGSGYVSSSLNNNIYTISVSGLQPSGNYITSIAAGTGIIVTNDGSAYTIAASGGGGGGTTIVNYGDNRLLTSDGTSTGINAESGLSYDGSNLSINGTNVSISGHTHVGDDISFVAYGISFNAATSGNIANFLWGLHDGDSGHLATYLTPSLDNIYASISHTHAAADVTDFTSEVSGLLPSVSGSGYVSSTFNGNTYTISVSGLQPSGDYAVNGHTHTSADITDFNSSVSGLLPVKDIIAGSFITVSGVSGSYTISTEGLQPYNGILDAIGAIATPFSNNIIYTTSTNTWSTTSLTAFGRSLIDDTDNTAARSTLGLVIGTNVQAYDATLNALAGVSTTADTIIYATGIDAFSTSSLTSFGRSLIDDADATAAKNTLNISKTIGFFTASDNMPPATNYATLDTRNSIAVLDFDGGSANEEAVFAGVIPHNTVTTSGLLVRINWMATTATTGNCRWGVQFEDMNTDTDADSFDTATEAHSATNATAGIPTVTEITCTNIDSLVAGDFYRMKIYRDASDTTNDTMAGDAELISVEVRSIA